MKKTTSVTRLIAGMIIWNALFILLAALVVSGASFYRQITSAYDEIDRTIAGEASTQLDEVLVKALSLKCDEILSGINEPFTEYNADIDAFYSKFASLTDTEGYAGMQAKLNAMRSATPATEIDFVLFYPEKELGIYIMDARDVTLVSCGELFEIPKKYFDKETGLFKGFYSTSRYFGRLRTNGVPLYEDKERGFTAYLTTDVMTSEINGRVIQFVIQIAIFSLLLSTLISLGINYYLRRHIVRPMKNITDAAGSFVEGYEERASIREGSEVFQDIDAGRIEEIKELLSSMQSMELEMNSYLSSLDFATREQERISTELSLATAIQANFLPNTFPPFPERTEFDIYATMTPAKEVGGDFYDFFLIDDDHLGLVMADVSGKGVPAALFMMVSKILVQNYAMNGMSPAEVLKSVNDRISANNKDDMFVTVWFGVLTISTGQLTAANAGHEYPVVRTGDAFELYKDKHGFVIGGMEGMSYKEYELALKKGDTLFLYTDGVPEATNAENELFGTDRMLTALNKAPDALPENLLNNVQKAVDEFVGEAPQFDDLTMLAVKLL